MLLHDVGGINAGAAPSDVRAEQTNAGTVLVTWTPPPAPPAAGYQVQVTGGTNITRANVTGISHNISVYNQLSVYSIQVMSLSAHLPGEVSAPVEVTIRGILMFSECGML